eukprot:Nitzschia sp. Nitz4//scaffold18_size181773//165258//166597//NITZ4_001942-RA/size181773-snap-gene-0.283-mRNA-1//-1//CDS//3329540092//4625//frame0
MAQEPPPEAKSLAKFSDGVTGLEYIQSSRLASICWDGTLQVHDTQAGSGTNNGSDSSALLTQTMESGPLLSLAILSGETMVTGGLNGAVKLFDATTSATTLLGNHASTASSSETSSNACSCLGTFAGNPNLVVSASWNKEMCLWDVRTPASPVSTLTLPGKAFSMNVNNASGPRVLVATAGRRNCLVDLRGDSKLEMALDRESSLKYQTRCVRFFPGGHGFALGSVEGRVGVEFLEELGVATDMKRYAFKCHRVNETIYPVNCIAFHPRFTSTFATGGCDGSVVLWDGENKKKLTAFPSLPTSISAIAFNNEGTQVAIASSYTFEDGDREHPQDEVFVRPILDSECMPKTK